MHPTNMVCTPRQRRRNPAALPLRSCCNSMVPPIPSATPAARIVPWAVISRMVAFRSALLRLLHGRFDSLFLLSAAKAFDEAVRSTTLGGFPARV